MKTEEEIKIDAKKIEYPLSEKPKRVFKPKIESRKCTRCMMCVVMCPDNAIEPRDGSVGINYDKCKGCLICLRECPFNAITEERE
ncbi:MAG: 4Fe-4S binding protein [Candidatus Aenigmatarchaeota archaeon]